MHNGGVWYLCMRGGEAFVRMSTCSTSMFCRSTELQDVVDLIFLTLDNFF